jgi:glucose/arabinose dehydrogenase
VTRAVVAGLALALVLASCGDDDASAPTTSPVATPTSGADATGADATDGEADSGPATTLVAVDDLSGAAVVLTQIAELRTPIAIASRPGSPMLYVATRGGRVYVLDPATGDEVGEPLVDIVDDTSTEVERGLLGLAFHPDGDRLYLSFTDRDGDTRVDEWRLTGDTVDPASRRTLYTHEQPYPNHNGGHLAFGPDGMLYLGLGDGGGGGDPLDAGQDPTTALGSLVRLDPTPEGDRPYSVPPDNPYVGGGGAPEVWAIGLRNPWRFAFDPLTGDLWVADVGQESFEEVNVVPAPGDGSAPGRGANFGWSIFEGDVPYRDGAEPDGYVGPVHTYPHGPGCSITGGVVVRDPRLPGLTGAYVFADYCDPTIWAVLAPAGELVEARSLAVQVPGGLVATFGTGPSGEVYVASLGGGLFRLDPVGG